jgi:hypothetical protein
MPAVSYARPAHGLFLLQLWEEFKSKAALDDHRHGDYVLHRQSCTAASGVLVGDKISQTAGRSKQADRHTMHSNYDNIVYRDINLGFGLRK